MWLSNRRCSSRLASGPAPRRGASSAYGRAEIVAPCETACALRPGPARRKRRLIADCEGSWLLLWNRQCSFAWIAAVGPSLLTFGMQQRCGPDSLPGDACRSSFASTVSPPGRLLRRTGHSSALSANLLRLTDVHRDAHIRLGGLALVGPSRAHRRVAGREGIRRRAQLSHRNWAVTGRRSTRRDVETRSPNPSAVDLRVGPFALRGEVWKDRRRRDLCADRGHQ
jgi:hypothetical protein